MATVYHPNACEGGPSPVYVCILLLALGVGLTLLPPDSVFEDHALSKHLHPNWRGLNSSFVARPAIVNTPTRRNKTGGEHGMLTKIVTRPERAGGDQPIWAAQRATAEDQGWLPPAEEQERQAARANLRAAVNAVQGRAVYRTGPGLNQLYHPPRASGEPYWIPFGIRSLSEPERKQWLNRDSGRTFSFADITVRLDWASARLGTPAQSFADLATEAQQFIQRNGQRMRAMYPNTPAWATNILS
ncbi:hypothetical protein JCM8547_008988 [Rhodosporidiobolus lusitaniae]